MIYAMRRAVLMLLMFVATSLTAQNMSVASFRLLENDLTANTKGTMETDFNGEVSALIKVVTTEKGFTFEGGMVGIVRVRQEIGEVWVYVPHGIKKITIRHDNLGVLRDYYFDIPIQKARTYEMVLTTGRVETVVTHTVAKQFVVFNVNPADAIVELNDEVLSVDGDGVAQQLMPYGSYNYRVSRPNYHTEAGRITVTAEGKIEKNITLRPNYGWIKMSGSSDYNGAYVYIDNERVGQFPYTSKELKSGTHTVKVVKSMYKTYEQKVTVSDNETTELNVQLVANFANVTLAAGADCEIWVDGELRGKEQWSGPLQIGDYTVEVRKASHRNASEIVHISTTEERTVQLKSPTPIYASVEISSTPSRSTVYLDGKEVGTTPLLMNDVLVGSHRIVFKKEGYSSADKLVELQEGTENKVYVELSNMKEVSIVSYPEGAIVTMDREYIGVTPLKTTLACGEHVFTFGKEGYNLEQVNIVVDGQTNTVDQHLSLKEVEITSNPSKATVTIDGKSVGVTPYTTTFENGNHTIALTKSGYVSTSVSKAFPTSDSFHFDLEKRYRPVTNDCYKSFALYADRYVGGAVGEHRYANRMGYSFGLYIGGFNVEIGKEDDGYSSYVRLGWGVKCGRQFLLTPQFGYTDLLYTKDTSDKDYYYNQGYYEDAIYTTISAGCRVQYCINSLLAVHVTPEFAIAPDNGLAKVFQLKAGVTLNLGL